MKRTKGITPVISIVLLLMITIALIGFAFVWFSKILTTGQEKGTIQLNTSIATMAKAIRVDNVYRGSTGTFTLTVRNVGATNIGPTDVTVYLNGAALTAAECPFQAAIAPTEATTCGSTVTCSPGDTVKVQTISNSDTGTC